MGRVTGGKDRQRCQSILSYALRRLRGESQVLAAWTGGWTWPPKTR